MPVTKKIAPVNTLLGDVAKEFAASAASAGSAPSFLFSSDCLSGYGLDLVFQMVKDAGFDGLDLAMWKNFDAWNADYVKGLSDKHALPVKVIQLSENVNEKEMNKALDLCYATGADTIAINAPSFLNFKSFNYLADNLPVLRENNKAIRFTLINPPNATMFALPIPKYRFSNIVEVIKKYFCYLGVDVSNMDSEALESDFMRKLKDFVPYIGVLYISDKNKAGEAHLSPGEGVLKLAPLLQKVKEYGYNHHISTKITMSKSDLADMDKVHLILKKVRKYYEDNYI